MAEVRATPGVPVAAQFAGFGAPTPAAPIVVDSLTGFIYTLKTGDVVVAAGAAGTGTVSSVAQSFTGGLISVAGSPITTTGTLALTVAGTSGGVPYFSGAATWASSGVLGAGLVVLGGGAGAAPTTLTAGASTTVLHGNSTYSAVSLTADVSGVLPIANGGGLAATNFAPTPSAAVNTTGTPTMSNIKYSRVGAVITMSGEFTADPVLTATVTSFEFDLPVASNLGATTDLSGIAFCAAIAGMGAAISGVIANNTALVSWVSTDINSQTWSWTAQYTVI